MKRLLLALVLLPLIAPQPADAARRDERRSQATSPATQPSKTAKDMPARRQTAPAPQRSQRQAAPAAGQASRNRQPEVQPTTRSTRRNVVVRGAAAATLPGRGACTRRGGCSSSSGIAGWQAGLPRTDYSQRECPSGTFATLARGHEDVVRCMPI